MLQWLIGAAFAGDVFVKADQDGARIFVDGVDTGLLTPAVVEGLPAGAHEIKVLGEGCSKGLSEVLVREHAIERLDLTLFEGTGLLTVLSTPVGARVSVDGQPLGEAPLQGQPVSCGLHLVEAGLEGYRAEQVQLEVGVDESHELVFTLEKSVTGSLVVMVEPLEAEVRVDGAPVGTGPLTLDSVEMGQHTVTASARGFEDGAVTVSVPKGGAVRADLVLTPVPRLGERLQPLKRVHWGTLGASSVFVGAGVLFALKSRSAWTDASAAYEEYVGLSYADDPAGFYAEQVEANQRRARVYAGTAVVMGVGSLGTLVFLPVLDPKEPALVVSSTF